MKVEALIQKYDKLAKSAGDLSIKELIRSLILLHDERQQLIAALKEENDENIYHNSFQKAIGYIVHLSREPEDFFGDIQEIKDSTYVELSLQLLNNCKELMDSTEQKAELVLRILKERLNRNPIQIGTTVSESEKQPIDWWVYEVNPVENYVSLLSKNPVEIKEYNKKGWTDIEDEDEYGCARTSCSWKDSDLRHYLNTEFFENAFSSEEKNHIVKAKLHTNDDDPLIPDDITTDHIYLITSKKCSELDDIRRRCSSLQSNETWWLRDEERMGWSDTKEAPQIFSVNCVTGDMIGKPANEESMIRPAMRFKLDKLVNLLEKEV